MPLDHLDTPLRMTWALDGRLGSDVLLQLADRLVAAGLFQLTVTGSPLDCRSLSDLVGRLAGRGMQVSLVTKPGDLLNAPPSGVPLSRVLLDMTPPTAAKNVPWREAAEAIALLEQDGMETGLQLLPLRHTLGLLPEMFNFAARYGLPVVSLPNIPVVDMRDTELAPLLLRAGDLAAFAADWKTQSAALPIPRELVVHDLFLWEILCPGQSRDHYAGCQAGNSLGHLDTEGILHPCSSWYQPMGSLLDDSLADYWQREVRHLVRAEVATSPAGCDGCGAYQTCFGGCRGLSRDPALAAPEMEGRDLMCPDRR